MFPSGKSDKDSATGGGSNSGKMASDEPAEELCDLPLERCVRIVPHDQNTGGFFIAALHKVSPLPDFPEKLNQRRNMYTRGRNSSERSSYEEVCDTVVTHPEETTEEIVVEAAASDNGLKLEKESTSEEGTVEVVPPVQKGKWKGLDPVVFLRDETVINGIKRFYGINDESFPLNGHLVTRNSDTTSKGNVKRIYYVSRSVKDVLELNLAVGQKIKVASVGLKMFEKQSARECEGNSCSFRITSEGLPVILPYMTKQLLYATMVDFKNLLQRKSIKFPDFVHPQFGQKPRDIALLFLLMVHGSEACINNSHWMLEAQSHLNCYGYHSGLRPTFPETCLLMKWYETERKGGSSSNMGSALKLLQTKLKTVIFMYFNQRLLLIKCLFLTIGFNERVLLSLQRR